MLRIVIPGSRFAPRNDKQDRRSHSTDCMHNASVHRHICALQIGAGTLRLAKLIYLVHSACPSVSFTILSPPDDSRHISTSLPAGTGLAQVICGLLSYLVVENLQVTMQEASPASEFVIMMLASSLPGKITQLNGTDSADAGVSCAPARSVN